MELFDMLWFRMHNMPAMLLIGLITFVGFYCGRGMRRLKLPSILAYMLLGVALGPSGANFLSDHLQETFAFIVKITLAFVALNIGLELNLKSLKSLGIGVVWVILAETFGAALLVTGVIYYATGNLPLALIFGGIAPASAPAGTVAVIREYDAKGPLTKILYAVVGFDDALTIIIFGFFVAISRDLLITEAQVSIWQNLWHSFKEIALVCVVGTALSFCFSYCIKPLKKPKNMLILTFCFVLITTGLSSMMHISMILTNMVLGFVISNTQPREVMERIELRLNVLMPLLFILFFAIAGAGLRLDKLQVLGMLGGVYIIARIVGLMGGAWLGAMIGKMPAVIRKYVGMGILSQAGVAVGLALIVRDDFRGLGTLVTIANGAAEPLGTYIGTIVLMIVTATSVFFELLGPILTRIALKKAGEIS